MTIKSIYLAAAMVVTAGAATAASVDFNVGRTWSSSGHTYGPVTVKGATVDTYGNILTTDERVASWSGHNGGLGICSSKYKSQCSYGTSEKYGKDQHTIDGKNKNELALIDFGSKKVEITHVSFSYWDKSDDFDFASFKTLVAGSAPTLWKEDIGEGYDWSSITFKFTPGYLVGSMFGFGADGNTDQFKLKSIKYNEVAEVPLPAGAALLLTGLVVVVAMRRRQNAA